ncbi:MAG: division/cell wall cluster transcriptional repressor MraZ [Sphingobium sp.]
MSAADNYHGSGFSGVDSKLRFTLPVDLRRRVKAGSADHNVLYINMTPDLTCLTGFGEDYLSDMKGQIEEEVAAARIHGQSIDRHQRAVDMVAGVERVTFDDGGRFSLPDEVRELMDIGDMLWFVGAIWTFEIWSPQRYLDSGQGSEISRMRCRKAMAEWDANPKNPNRKAA